MKEKFPALYKVIGKLREHPDLITWYDDYFDERFHRKNQSFPVIGLKASTNHLGENFYKVIYYQTPVSSKVIKEDTLSATLSDQALYQYVLDCLYNEDNFEEPLYFIIDSCRGLKTPLYDLHMIHHLETRTDLHVRLDEMVPAYVTSDGASLSTEMIFDVSFDLDRLNLEEWYHLHVGDDSINNLYEIEELEDTILIVASNDVWGVGVSMAIPKDKPYDIKLFKNKRGISFKRKVSVVQKVWIKVAWMKIVGCNSEDWRNAFRKWLR